MSYNLLELLNYIDPASLDYNGWTQVGMALKIEGYDCSDWDAWSQRDSARYKGNGECEKKWDSFQGSAVPVTGGTIVQMAKERGFSFPSAASGYELDWNSEIDIDDVRIVDAGWLESREVEQPKEWDPAGQLIRYLETLFEPEEVVGYVTESWRKEDRYLPTKGVYHQTAGQLIEGLSKCEGDLGRVLGDYDPAAGAWIRFNPLDGNGVKNENVTEFRFALVESDTMDIDKQNAVIRELELPVACLVHSGGKSLHAIVRIDAVDYGEYKKRVDYLYSVLRKNGMDVDLQNKNPSRLSRMPGVMRLGNKQFLVDTHLGKSTWAEWKEWIEGISDDLPDQENLFDLWDDLPALAPELIRGVLRHGHKMLLTGPSKAGKSFALIELCIAIAEGREWMGFPCAPGRVLYVNLELDRASCLHRFKDVYRALQWPVTGLRNLDIWNLRGKSVPMDKLAPKLIRRAVKQNYTAIVIDPIYKVITGDENSADQMANFCNQFDKVCTELGCAVIYCHHHSKGAQGNKRSMDRASGSGVFARDPDTLLDMIELPLSEELLKARADKARAQTMADWIVEHVPGGPLHIYPDDRESAVRMTEIVERVVPEHRQDEVWQAAEEARRTALQETGWRIEGTLREFPKHPPVNCWFCYPIHVLDDSGVLGDVEPEEEQSSWRKKPKRRRDTEKPIKSEEERKAERKASLDMTFGACNTDGQVTVKDLAEFMGKSEKSVRRHIAECGGYTVKSGVVFPAANKDKTE